VVDGHTADWVIVVARTEEGLTACLETILQLQQRAKNLCIQGSRMFNPGWHTSRDDLFMLTICEAVLRCALERRESRGAHWRTDYEGRHDLTGLVNYLAQKADGEMQVTSPPVTPTPATPPDLFT